MKISTEAYQHQSYSRRYARFTPRYVQPDYALSIEALRSYSFVIGTLQKDALSLLIALNKSSIDPMDLNGQKFFFENLTTDFL